MNIRIRGKKPTREERKIIESNDLNTYMWLVKIHTTNELKLIHKDTGEIKVITL